MSIFERLREFCYINLIDKAAAIENDASKESIRLILIGGLIFNY